MGAQAAHRGDVDDASTAPLDHVPRRQEARTVNHPDVALEGESVGFLIEFLKGPGAQVRSVVDEQMNAAETLNRLLENALSTLRSGNIGGDPTLPRTLF